MPHSMKRNLSAREHGTKKQPSQGQEAQAHPDTCDERPVYETNLVHSCRNDHTPEAEVDPSDLRWDAIYFNLPTRIVALTRDEHGSLGGLHRKPKLIRFEMRNFNRPRNVRKNPWQADKRLLGENLSLGRELSSPAPYQPESLLVIHDTHSTDQPTHGPHLLVEKPLQTESLWPLVLAPARR